MVFIAVPPLCSIALGKLTFFSSRLSEETPIRVLRDELLRAGLDQSRFDQHLQRVAIAVRVTSFDQQLRDSRRFRGAQIGPLENGAEHALRSNFSTTRGAMQVTGSLSRWIVVISGGGSTASDLPQPPWATVPIPARPGDPAKRKAG
jgi:hypothetical protein